jgi:VWFA-related protein
MINNRSFVERVTAALVLVAALFASPAWADVALRVEAKPVSDPIEAFVTVTDTNGDPVGGLAAGDFTLTLDGVVVSSPGFTLPSAQDPNQKVSVIFAMDYSSSVQTAALTAMQDAVMAFINAMNVGDFAAIVKFNDTNPERASVVQEFTEIDGGAGTSALIGAVMAPYDGEGTNLLDGIDLAIAHFGAPPLPLPDGPKAVIVVSDGGENSSNVSQSTVIDNANNGSIPLFTIGVGNFQAGSATQLLTSLATETGGDFLPAPDDQAIADAYVTIQELLTNEYLLTFPSSISDCDPHTLEVAVTGQATPASVTFTRCDITPEAFSFSNSTGVDPSAVVTSNAVTVSGIDGPAQVSVVGGEYSIGCGTTFTSAGGSISNGQTICVRHTASAAFSTANQTTLTVGGVSGTFTSTTRAAPVEPRRGGGGAMGVLELLFGLAALYAGRRSHGSSQIRMT